MSLRYFAGFLEAKFVGEVADQIHQHILSSSLPRDGMFPDHLCDQSFCA
jgi:hypothetical protein